VISKKKSKEEFMWESHGKPMPGPPSTHDWGNPIASIKIGEDLQEWEDRILQAVNFVGAGGPTRLQERLPNGKNTTQSIDYYWVYVYIYMYIYICICIYL